MIDDKATEAEFCKIYMDITMQLAEAAESNPPRNILVVSVFAGHGILKNGTQTLVLNEYDQESEFYKLLEAEHKMRLLSDMYSNSYIIAIFACCREIFDFETMAECADKNSPQSQPWLGKAKSTWN